MSVLSHSTVKLISKNKQVMDRTPSELLNNKYYAFKASIRNAYSGWTALNFVLQRANVSSENDMVDWMVSSTVAVLHDFDDLTGEELALWLDEIIITQFQHKIRDGSIQIVANNVFSHFMRFKPLTVAGKSGTAAIALENAVNGIDIGKKAVSITRADTPIPIPILVPNNSVSENTESEEEGINADDDDEDEDNDNDEEAVDADDEYWEDIN